MSGPARLMGLVWPHRRGVVLAFACMVVLAAANGLYAYLTGPLLTFLINPTGATGGGAASLGKLGQLFPQLVANLDRSRALVVLPALILGIALIKGAAYLGQFYLMGMVGQGVVADIRRSLFSKLLGLSPTWYEAHHSGDLLSRFTADVASVELFATYGVAAVLRDTTQLLVLLLVLFSLDWRLSSVGLVVIPVCAIPVSRLAKRLREQTRLSQAALGRLGERVQEGLWGHRIIQAYGIREQELQRFDLDSDRYVDQMLRAIRARTLTPAMLELFVVGALSLVLALAWKSNVLAPELLVSFIAALAMLYQPAKDLGRVSPWLLQATAGAERIYEILDAVDTLGLDSARPERSAHLGLDSARPERSAHLGLDSARPDPVTVRPEPVEGPTAFNEVRFQHVDLAYPHGQGGSTPVLRGLDLRIRRGECVGLVGESGGGKSTVVKLLLRFMDPTGGQVTINGTDIRQMPLERVRACCGLVTQEPLLFSDTVRANIAYARPGASLEEVRAAAAVAFAGEFIAELPKSFDTPIGERGVRLSGGQKQRIALARAVLAAAPLLVLDEATSSLDAESEREVQQALDQLLVGRTALIIAHRLSAVRRATRICVLAEGRIVEEGTHQELLARGGRYAAMAALQGEGAPRQGPEATPPNRVETVA